jgi:flagellar basal body rod protein FlgG
MSGTTEQVSTSIDALMREYEIITHNLANVSTAGFKRRCNAFSRVLDEQSTQDEDFAPGTIDLNSAFDFSQGSMVETRRKLDFALYGKGFFVIETPEGPLYTRNGLFNLNENRQLVDLNGRTVAGESGQISIPSNYGISQITVSDDGTISADGNSIGKFRIVDFADDESKLIPTGANCYKMPDEEVVPVTAENIIVRQGFQESSNVQVVEELVDLIMVSRLYEANMEFLTVSKQNSSSLMSVAMG